MTDTDDSNSTESNVEQLAAVLAGRTVFSAGQAKAVTGRVAGLSTRETAAVFDIDPGTIRSHLHRARASIVAPSIRSR
jgi:DNA-directed RNA polymerase specialized sigma24 family protein